MSPNTPAKPAEKPATKSQAEIDKETAAAATNASEKPADHIPAPGEPGYTPPETVPDEVANTLDAATGATTSTTDAEHGSEKDSEDDLEYRGAAVRVTRLTDLLKAKKDEFIIYGYGGVAITLGDLRGLLSKYKA